MMSAKAILTQRQQEIYDFLRDKILNRGYGPTVREIGTQFGIKSPNGVMCHLKALEKKGLIIRESHMSRAIQLTDHPLPSMTLALNGDIAAGSPVLAVEQKERVDFAKLFDGEENFCLRVRGDSMIEDQIADRDYVIVRRQKTCRDGDIVVALVDGEDATLKRFYRESNRVRLEPANASLAPIFCKHVDVMGVVVGVVRQY